MMNLLTDKDWRYTDHQTDNVNTADLVLLICKCSHCIHFNF